MQAFVAPAPFARPLARPLALTTRPSQPRGLPAPRRRCRVLAADRLYPEPSQPERIDNPLDAAAPSSSTDDYLTRLNRSSASASGGSGPKGDAQAPQSGAVTKAFAPAARAFWRLGWATWWVQLVLTVIAAVIILFSFMFPGVNVRSTASVVGFVLAAAGVVLAFLSLACTYGYTRLSLWLQRPTPKLTLKAVDTRITNSLRLGLVLAIAGLALSLLGLQAIVGTLLARLLSAGIASTPYQAYGNGARVVNGPAVVQPVDVLVVQASANAMTGLLFALVVTVWFRGKAKGWRDVASGNKKP